VPGLGHESPRSLSERTWFPAGQNVVDCMYGQNI
jgi:hypothetical protein